MDVENANCKLRVSQCADMEVLPIERPLKIEREVTGLEVLVEELHRVFSKDHVNVQDVQKLMAGYKSDPKDWKKYAKFDRFRYTRNLVDAGNGAFNAMILCWGPGNASAIHDHADSHCFMKMLSGNLEEVRYDWPETIQPEIFKKMNRPRKRCCSETQEKLAQLARGCKNKTCPNFDNNEEQNGEKINGVNGSNGVNGNNSRNQRYNVENNNGKVNGCTKENEKDINGNEDIVYESENMKEIGRTRLEVNDVCYINDALGLHRMENPSHVHGAVSLHLYCPPFDSCRVFDARTGKPTEVKVTFWSMYGKKVKRIVADVNDVDSQE